MRVKIKEFFSHQPFGNHGATFSIEGVKGIDPNVIYAAIRQGGGLNFWAFPLRPEMSPEEQKEFDRQLDSQDSLSRLRSAIKDDARY